LTGLPVYSPAMIPIKKRADLTFPTKQDAYPDLTDRMDFTAHTAGDENGHRSLREEFWPPANLRR